MVVIVSFIIILRDKSRGKKEGEYVVYGEVCRLIESQKRETYSGLVATNCPVRKWIEILLVELYLHFKSESQQCSYPISSLGPSSS